MSESSTRNLLHFVSYHVNNDGWNLSMWHCKQGDIGGEYDGSDNSSNNELVADIMDEDEAEEARKYFGVF